jgi:ABC-2 type transport system ATP-binding protein
VIVIGHGAILADQPLAAFRTGVMAERRVIADFAGVAPTLAIPGVRERRREGNCLELAFDPAVIGAPALIAAIAADHALEDIRVAPPQIEEVIARFYDLHGAAEA